ncbi:MAG: hypothetical protein RBS56_01205 [Candidatus Gracilibacteria bacterium]|jgi:hypothetical protein|nr:hypothetical protein [Candidatus Gracilibacteria bacterium]
MGIDDLKNSGGENLDQDFDFSEDKEAVKWRSQSELQELRNQLREDPSRDTITVEFDLGEYKKDPELKNLMSDKETSLLRVQASVDTAVHKQKSDKLKEYVKGAEKILSCEKYFTPGTKAFFEKNRSAIIEIANLNPEEKDLKNSKSWELILNKYGDSITDSDGALNFILAFMRATDDKILAKIENGEVGKSFSIDLFVEKKKSSAGRKAIFELRLPEGASRAGREADLNLGLIMELESDASFWQKYNPDRFAVMFMGDSSKFGKMYKELIDFKRKNPDTFAFYPKYEKALKIVTQNLASFYTTYGAVLPDANQRLKEYGKILDEDLSIPSDPLAIWTTKKTLEWLNNPQFVINLMSSSVEPLLGKKGLLTAVYGETFNAGKVSIINESLFRVLTKILKDFKQGDKTAVEMLDFNLEHARFE